MSETALERIEFANNPAPRCPLALVLDVSGSMAGAPINALNGGLQILKSELMADPVARSRVEVAIITFGTSVANVQDFVTVENWNPPILDADGTTPLGEALNIALDEVELRKNIYQRNGIPYYRPWIVMITDGNPTDSWERAAQRLRMEEQRSGATFFAIAVEDADMDVLSQISVRPPLHLRGLAFRELFSWLSASQKRVSASRVDEQVALPPVNWSTV